jgi:hypothetical protein
MALDLGVAPRNASGYVGIDYIDDVNPYYGIEVEVHDGKDAAPFATYLSVRYLIQDGTPDPEALPLDVGWNASVKRYQEINWSTSTFIPEKKTVPRLSERGRCPGSVECRP